MVRPLSPRYCCLFVVSIHCQDYMIDEYPGPRMLIRGVWVVENCFMTIDDLFYWMTHYVQVSGCMVI